MESTTCILTPWNLLVPSVWDELPPKKHFTRVFMRVNHIVTGMFKMGNGCMTECSELCPTCAPVVLSVVPTDEGFNFKHLRGSYGYLIEMQKRFQIDSQWRGAFISSIWGHDFVKVSELASHFLISTFNLKCMSVYFLQLERHSCFLKTFVYFYKKNTCC